MIIARVAKFASSRVRQAVCSLREAASFLTTLVSAEGSISPDALSYFPLVGIGLGLAEGSVWALLRRFCSASVASSTIVLADLALTGGLHLDGLADSADGLLAHAPAKDRLEIMSEPAIGTYGACAIAASFTSRTAALSAVNPSPPLLALVLCASRSLMVFGICVFPQARRGGLADGLTPKGDQLGRTLVVSMGAMLASLVLAARIRGLRGAVGLFAGLLAGLGVLLLGRRRLGGQTGDVLGAAGAVCEAVGLLAMSR